MSAGWILLPLPRCSQSMMAEVVCMLQDPIIARTASPADSWQSPGLATSRLHQSSRWSSAVVHATPIGTTLALRSLDRALAGSSITSSPMAPCSSPPTTPSPNIPATRSTARVAIATFVGEVRRHDSSHGKSYRHPLIASNRRYLASIRADVARTWEGNGQEFSSPLRVRPAIRRSR